MESILFSVFIIHRSYFIASKDRTSLECINLVKQSLILWCKCQSSQFSKFFYMLYDLSTLHQLTGFFYSSFFQQVSGSLILPPTAMLIQTFSEVMHGCFTSSSYSARWHMVSFMFRAAHCKNPAQPSWRTHFIPHAYTLSRYSQVPTFWVVTCQQLHLCFLLGN